MLVSTSIPGNCTVSTMNGGLVVLMNMLGGGGAVPPGGFNERCGADARAGISNNLVVGSGGTIGVEPIQATIWHCLNNYAYADACFLAERVHAEAPSDETLHTLSTAYYRSGSKTKAYVLLSTSLLKTPHQMSAKNRYLLSLVSYELEKYAEAESTLLKSLKHDSKSSSQVFEQIERAYGEIGSFALKLYALICVQTERSQQAFEAFSRCLKLNPFLWNAYEHVCRLGMAGNAPKERNKENEDGTLNSTNILAPPQTVPAPPKRRNTQQQRVFQLPDSNPPPPSSSTVQSSTVASIPPSTYLPILIGSTAASLILHQSSVCQKPNYYDNAANNQSFQNNQNYYAKDSSLNMSNSSVFLANSTTGGVLHPSNRSNIKPSKRNLFTSTPMGGGIGGTATGDRGNLLHGTGNNFGIIPLHLMMDSSSASTVSNANTSSAQHVTSSINMTNASSPGMYSSPIGGGGVGSVVHSPVVGDFTDELTVGSGVGTDRTQYGGTVDPPRPKKPCLRTQWQQQVTGGGSSAQGSSSSSPQLIQTHGTVTISTSTNHTLRRSSRLFTHGNHHHLKENNKMNPPILQTPPSSNVQVVTTPDSANSSGGGSTRRSGKGNKQHERGTVLKPKLRLNNSTRGSDVKGSSSSTSTITGVDLRVDNVESSPIIAAGKDGNGGGGGGSNSLLESSSDFYRYVTEKSDRDIAGDSQAGDINRGDKIGKFEDRVALAVEAFRNGVDPLLHMLSNLSAPYTSQNAYNCSSAISQYQRLKPSQYETGWVYGNIARCYFELGNYEECIKSYKRMMEIEPWRTDGLEWLSTAYWHLQKETELSALAQDLMKSNRTNEVATWVAAGNCFSLHKEHETAIKFFKRAIQVNRYCAYAYTLLGHEYVVTEELEKAMRCFRSATRIDCSHYNAWYGMGMIFYKQERYDRAEVYYKKALGIHPNNSVLLCHLGVVQHALGRAEKSLGTFNRALEANKNDPLCKFHRASVLFGIGKLDEALDELEELKEIVPKESLVYFLIAKIFSKKGDTHKALLHFSWATDLDPKGANNQIKESIEPVLSRVTNTTNALLTTVNSSTAVEQSTQDEEEEEQDDDDEDEEEEEEEEAGEEEDPNEDDDNGTTGSGASSSSSSSSNNQERDSTAIATTTRPSTPPVDSQQQQRVTRNRNNNRNNNGGAGESS